MSKPQLHQKLRILYFVVLMLAFGYLLVGSDNIITVELTNGDIVQDTLEFDVLLSSNRDDTVIKAYQCVIDYEGDIKDFYYIGGTSELKNKPSVLIKHWERKNKITFASTFKNDSLEVGKPVRIGRFAIVSDSVENVSLAWDFRGFMRTLFAGNGWKSLSGYTEYKDLYNITDVKSIYVEKSDGFYLNQNYPNPGNGHTIIEFGVKEESELTLTLYNILGQRVRNIYYNSSAKGAYSIGISTTDLPSGLYVYVLSNGREQIAKKMNVLK